VLVRVKREEGRGKDVLIVWNCWSAAEALHNTNDVSIKSRPNANANTIKGTNLRKGTKRREEKR
jgi:hypothetical protein